MTDQRPMCPLCKTKHFAREPHVFGKTVPQPSELCRSAPVANGVANNQRPVRPAKTDQGQKPAQPGTSSERAKKWREKNRDAYNAKQRELMRAKRAKKPAEVKP